MKKYLLGDPGYPDVGDGLGIVMANSPETLHAQCNEPAPTRSAAPYRYSQANDRHSITRQNPVRRRRGTRAPRSSMAFAIPQIRFSDSSSSGSSSQTIKPDDLEEVQWKNYDIPQELELVFGDTPQEIRDIIQESLDKHRALRASTLLSPSGITGDSVECLDRSALLTPPPAHTDSSCSSAHSSPGSYYSRRTGSTSSNSQDSFTSVDSENPHEDFLQPRKIAEPSTSHSLSESGSGPSSPKVQRNYKHSSIFTAFTGSSQIESMSRESKDRTSKGHKLYKFLPGRMLKAIPSPEFLKAEPASVECTSCFDEIPYRKAVHGLPCRHSYCSSCFSHLVSTAVLNEDTFPPRCCLQEVPNKVLRTHLSDIELTAYDEKALEYAVAVGSRYYCASPTCGRWIDTRLAKRYNGALECPHCSFKLCAVCRGPQHPSNEDCPHDYGLDATLEEAERAGWRRCYSCRAMVELNTGCRHITCKCRAEFCYTCGAKWRTCSCTEADQARRERDLDVRRIQHDADVRAEQEEIRAAIAAVEAAERQLQEEREAEERLLEQEAQELAQRESERVQRITKHFESLSEMLEKVRLQQKHAIEKRHARHEKQLRNLSEATMAEKGREILDDRDSLAAQNKGMLKALQREHASALMETIARHRRAQDDLLLPANSVDNNIPDPDAELRRAAILDQLLPAQDLERTTLKEQQCREMGKWQARCEKRLGELDTEGRVRRMREEERGRWEREVRGVGRGRCADLRWAEVLAGERVGMLEEERRGVLGRGGDVGLGGGVGGRLGLGRGVTE